MKSLSRRALAVGLILVAAAAARAQVPPPPPPAPMPGMNGGKTPEERRERVLKDVESAAEQVQKYENLVLKYKNRKSKSQSGGQELSNCLRDFDVTKVYSIAAKSPLDYHQKAVNYQACEALREGSAQSCLLLSTMGGDKDEHLVDSCQRFEMRIAVDKAVGSGSGAAAMSSCVQMLSPDMSGEGLKSFPADARAKVCGLLLQGASVEKVREALLSSATPPSQQDTDHYSCVFAAFLEAHPKCNFGGGNGFDAVFSTTRARIARDPEKCGSNALCRAAFGQKNACDPLYDDFARTYCKEVVSVETKNAVNDPAVKELQDAYVAANVAVNSALNEAYGLEPHNDDENAAVIEKAKRVRTSLNDAPRWGEKPAPKTKKGA